MRRTDSAQEKQDLYLNVSATTSAGCSFVVAAVAFSLPFRKDDCRRLGPVFSMCSPECESFLWPYVFVGSSSGTESQSNLPDEQPRLLGSVDVVNPKPVFDGGNEG
jgi:hypothetical protein